MVDHPENESPLATNAERLKVVEAHIQRVVSHAAKQDQRVGDIAYRMDTISQRLVALTEELVHHLDVDNQWWRKTIAAIIDDIDGLRRLSGHTSDEPTPV